MPYVLNEDKTYSWDKDASKDIIILCKTYPSDVYVVVTSFFPTCSNTNCIAMGDVKERAYQIGRHSVFLLTVNGLRIGQRFNSILTPPGSFYHGAHGGETVNWDDAIKFHAYIHNKLKQNAESYSSIL